MSLRTKTINGSTNSSSWKFKLVAIENSTSQSTNKSNLTVEAFIGRGSTGSYMIGAKLSCLINVTGCNSQTLNYSESGKVTVGANSWVSLGSKTFEVPHNDNGKKDITISAEFTNNVSPSNGSASGLMSLTNIPRGATIKNADNFNDEGNPKIEYSNPAGNLVELLQVFLTPKDNDNVYAVRDLPKTGTTYTINLSDSERKQLLSEIPNSNSLVIQFYVKTIIDGVSYYSHLSKTMTVTNGSPTFTDFTYKDTNAKITAITGNNQVLVKGLSTLQATISSSNKMVANKQATVKNYVATIDNINRNVDYTVDDLNIDLGTVSNSGTNRLSIRAYDSRNNSTLVYKDITIYDYDKPVINATVERLNNFEDQTTLKVSGTYSKLTIGGTDKNIITKLQYRYREVGGEWTGWVDLIGNVVDGKYECDDVILSLDNSKFFEFEIKAKDNLDEQILSLPLGKGKAIFFVCTNEKCCYINDDEILSASQIYEVGDIFLSINDTNPSSRFGGTWELISKGRTLIGVDPDNPDFNASQKTGGLLEHQHELTDAKAQITFTSGSLYMNRENSSTWDANQKQDGNIGNTSVSESRGTAVPLLGKTDKQSSLPPYFTCYMWLRVA